MSELKNESSLFPPMVEEMDKKSDVSYDIDAPIINYLISNEDWEATNKYEHKIQHLPASSTSNTQKPGPDHVCSPLWTFEGNYFFTPTTQPPAYPDNPICDTPNIPTAWTTATAKPWIKKFQKLSRDYGYHVCLGGSVLNKGASEKDLDIYFLPMGDQIPRNPGGLLEKIEEKVNDTPEEFGPSSKYPETQFPYIWKGKVETIDEKRIDIFILGTSLDREKLKDYVGGFFTVELNKDHILSEDDIEVIE